VAWWVYEFLNTLLLYHIPLGGCLVEPDEQQHLSQISSLKFALEHCWGPVVSGETTWGATKAGH